MSELLLKREPAVNRMSVGILEHDDAGCPCGNCSYLAELVHQAKLISKQLAEVIELLQPAPTPQPYGFTVAVTENRASAP